MNRTAPVLALLGPTATGKTALAVALAEALDGEVISVDSALVYRGMDIGTAKPTEEERRGIPHHLIDILEPTEAWSAASFRQAALECIEQIHARGHLPILAGGTMLYFKALFEGLAELPEADSELRARLEAERAERGLAALHAELAEVDPEAAARIRPTDPQRILRALEVWHLTGIPLSEHHRRQRAESFPWPLRAIGLLPADRARLHARIAERFDAMLAAGFLDEVRALRARGDLTPDLPSMRSVGYRQAWAFLEGEYDADSFRDKAIAATRQLAKRQITWMRGMRDHLTLHDPFETSPEVLTERALSEAEAFCRGAS
ncbi:MAG: tRNA (adenosine(37)-N6)-dimethylallyltransferase MiaA [Gammaproteobacteria bacterium]|nr:MAG: tRNA (adenosine(37)-N6)-dimethylallyltransferase MiaA [Gammaproteobacteria bacterium]